MSLLQDGCPHYPHTHYCAEMNSTFCQTCMQVVLAHHEGIDSSNLPAAASSSSSNRLIRFTVATAAQLTRMAQEDLQQLEVTKLCLQQGINALSEESFGSFGNDYTKKKQQDSSSRMSSSSSSSSSAWFDAIRREGKRAKDEVSRLSQQLMDELSRRRRELHESIDLHVERCCAALDTLRSCAQSVTDVLERVNGIDKGNDDDRAAMPSSSSLVFNSLHRLVRKVELLSSKEERLVLNAHLALRNTFPVPRDHSATTAEEEEEEERQGAVPLRNRSTLLTLPTAHSEEQVRLCPFRLRLNPCFVLSEIRRWDVKCDLPCIAEEASRDNNNVAAVGPIASDHLSSTSFRWQSEKEDAPFTNKAAGNESSSSLNYSRCASQSTMKPTTHHRGWRSHQGLPAKCAYQRHIRTPDPALLLRRLLPHHHNSSNEHQMT
jgi:hypothetical protein